MSHLALTLPYDASVNFQQNSSWHKTFRCQCTVTSTGDGLEVHDLGHDLRHDLP